MKSQQYATKKALLRAVSRLRFVEGECRDLKREMVALEARMTTVRAFLGGADTD